MCLCPPPPSKKKKRNFNKIYGGLKISSISLLISGILLPLPLLNPFPLQKINPAFSEEQFFAPCFEKKCPVLIIILKLIVFSSKYILTVRLVQETVIFHYMAAVVT